ncbi:MAG: aldo/keto reductase [Chloroflexota bacterium]|nr:aldo/keto reductase [Chloroflexota bacterium]
MRKITIPGTDVVTSALGLGCADLYREPTASRRRLLLDVAHDAGIRHFDVAPMYGLGLAERELGRFARGRRDHIVIATKFGIAPTAISRAIGRVQGPARRLMTAFPSLRQRARATAAGPSTGAAGATLYRAMGFDAKAARSSLERSLRELGTDHVDVLLLHDPQPHDVFSDDVCGYLEEAHRAGLIRAWGVAGEPEATLDVAEAMPVPAPVVQVRHDLLLDASTRRRCALFAGRITFGVLGRTLDAVVRHVAADAERGQRWREAVGTDCADRETAARLMLRQAARDNPSGVVLFSSIRPHHVSSGVRAVEQAEPDDESLDAFIGLVRAELDGSRALEDNH